MAGATHQDAMVLLKLMEVSALRGMPVPLAWLSGTEFDTEYASFRRKCPPGSDHFEQAMAIVQHYETLGVLWKHGLVEEDLAFDATPVEAVWERIQGFVHGVREELKAPMFGAHFEMMARAVIGIEAIGVEHRTGVAAPVG
jgi:hypothetical protein